MEYIINITIEINFSSKVYSKNLLKGHLCCVPHLSKSYLVQKYGGRYFAKVKRIDILFQKYGGRYFAKVKRIDILFQKYGGRYFAKVKEINILSRSMEADMFNKRIGAYGYIL